jgi:hypothetical protein
MTDDETFRDKLLRMSEEEREAYIARVEQRVKERVQEQVERSAAEYQATLRLEQKGSLADRFDSTDAKFDRMQIACDGIIASLDRIIAKIDRMIAERAAEKAAADPRSQQLADAIRKL